MNVVDAARERASAARKGAGTPNDLERILGLERWLPSPGEQAGLAHKWTRELRRTPSARPLRPIQGYILEACHRAAQHPNLGILGNVGVGAGKTLAFLNMPRIFGAERAVLLVPPSMVEPLADAVWEWEREYKFAPVTVVPYSKLSRPEASDMLRRLSPDLILADECQNLKNATAARTKRFLRYMYKENPSCRFVAMSGTLSTTSLEDYAHLANLACRGWSPLPHHAKMLEDWSSVLSSNKEPDQSGWRSIAPLVSHFAGSTGHGSWSVPAPGTATDDDEDIARESYQANLASAPFVVTTVKTSSAAAITLRGVRPDLNSAARDAMDRLSRDMVLPDGSDVVDALHFHRAMRQISLGFYYIWDWPDEPDLDWLDARKTWAAAVRWYLKRYSREGVDSPFLVESYIRRELSSGGKPPPILVHALEQWDDQRHKDPPPVRPIWMDVSPVAYAVQWARKHDRAFLWFRSRAVGDMLADFDVPVFWKGDPSPDSTPVCALSTAVYHAGHNFQAWNKQLVMEPGPNGAEWEQLLGRTHRAGQTANEVAADIYQHTWPLQHAMKRALKRSRYIASTSGQPQKLLLSTRTNIG